MTEPEDQSKLDTAIEEVERLRGAVRGRPEPADPGWSLTGWQTVDWLLLALILSFVLYMLLPRA